MYWATITFFFCSLPVSFAMKDGKLE